MKETKTSVVKNNNNNNNNTNNNNKQTITTRTYPFSEKLTERTAAACPVSELASRPALVSHTRSTLAVVPALYSRPSGWKAPQV